MYGPAPPPPVCVSDWAKIGLIRNVSYLEAAAEQLLHWPNTPKRDKAARLIADAHAGKDKISDAKRAFEAAAKEARVWLPYRGP
jgi:hypothetical protein